MVLIERELHFKNGQRGIYSLAVIIVYTSITVFRSITTILTITLEKKTHISSFSLRSLKLKSVCASEVSETFFGSSINELPHRIANDFVNKSTSN